MKTLKDKVALIMAGGTGGHVYPALAVAEALRAQGMRVHWLGTRNGIEARVVPQAGIPISFLEVKGLRGNGFMRWLMAPVQLLMATAAAVRVCQQQKPAFILGMGGFVSWPGGVASRLLGKPLIIHEQNAIPGLTNRLLSHLATRVLEAFPSAFKPGRKVFHTGNPVRQSIQSLPAPEQRYAERDAAFRVLIIGGSLGAQALNETVPAALAQLADSYALNVWHQAGKKKAQQTEQAYQANHQPARVVEFIDDIDQGYRWADLIICRAGAMTVAELCCAGVASILVPYPHAVDDHQTANARYLSDASAAVLMPQTELTATHLAAELKKLFSQGRTQLLDMANRALQLASPDATKLVMQHCLEVA